MKISKSTLEEVERVAEYQRSLRVFRVESVTTASPPGFWSSEPHITVQHPDLVPGKRYRIVVEEEESG